MKVMKMIKIFDGFSGFWDECGDEDTFFWIKFNKKDLFNKFMRPK
jgi:hypothetical protein